MEMNIVIVILALICMYLLSTVMGLNSRVKGLEYRLKQISKHIGLPEMPINNELRQLINEGNDVKAVKKVRETLGFSLIKAKQYVDALKLEAK